MQKEQLKSLKNQLKNHNKKEINDYKWVITITIIAFLVSLLFSSLSENIIPNVNIYVGIFILIVFILIGIVFDIIGVAVTAADITPFNSMNSRKIKGADIAVLFKKNSDKVASFCNDVGGDICGIISGSTGAIISLSIANKFNFDTIITSLIVTSLIAAITIGAKALGKSFAINRSNVIMYNFAKFISYFYKIKK